MVLYGLILFSDYPRHYLFFGLAWTLANFINYPRVISRRYISYYNLMALSFRQLITFYIIYGLYYAFLNSVVSPVKPIETLPIFIILLSRLIYVYVLRLYRNRGRGYNRFVLIGDTPLMEQLKKRFLQKKSYGYVHEGTLNQFDSDQIKETIISRQLNEIYCSSACINQDEISQLLSLSFQFGTRIHVVTDNESHSEDEEVDTIPLDFGEPQLENYPLADEKNLIVKRIFDFGFSLVVAICLLSWVTLILGILIKIESRGPIFFTQPRAGRNGRYFTCLKFRSMYVTAGNKQATKNDPRVTRIGRFIRKTSIDELPQFLNVLVGQMSVVGPRPHVKQLNDKYDKSIANYNDRVLVKPGITGLSQIRGYRGETKENESMKGRIQTDILYLRNWSLYLDLVIIYKTVLDILRNKSVNAY